VDGILNGRDGIKFLDLSMAKQGSAAQGDAKHSKGGAKLSKAKARHSKGEAK
jgi:hypothetical protein